MALVGGPGRGFLVDVVDSGFLVELAPAVAREESAFVPFLPPVVPRGPGFPMGTAVLGGRVMGGDDG